MAVTTDRNGDIKPSTRRSHLQLHLRAGDHLKDLDQAADSVREDKLTTFQRDLFVEADRWLLAERSRAATLAGSESYADVMCCPLVTSPMTFQNSELASICKHLWPCLRRHELAAWVQRYARQACCCISLPLSRRCVSHSEYPGGPRRRPRSVLQPGYTRAHFCAPSHSTFPRLISRCGNVALNAH